VGLFTSLQGADILITRLSLIQKDAKILPVSITGTATDRQALATFRDQMLAHPLITEVDLPISNLASDKDILFSLSVTMANPNDV
jgi:hypothetical protein